MVIEAKRIIKFNKLWLWDDTAETSQYFVTDLEGYELFSGSRKDCIAFMKEEKSC